jgi:hypothetical protein
METPAIKEVAQFVSEYGVHEGLITNVEVLLTRIIINKASTYARSTLQLMPRIGLMTT